MSPDISDTIFRVKNQEDFKEEALKIFSFQAQKNIVYSEFISKPGISKKVPVNITDIPFLPVGFFKSRKIISGSGQPEIIFESSGTTGSRISRHYITDTDIYKKSLSITFRIFYGDPSEYCIIALLPSYRERKNSSLVYMMNELISLTGEPLSGFYSDDMPKLLRTIDLVRKSKRKILPMGVSYALLDLAEMYSPDLHDVIVMETGGMKGRRKEITRHELHSILRERMNVPSIHSEYGMTELLSQSYSEGNGIFYCPPWMKILIRDPYDPLSVTQEPEITGGINIIDLANINSCSFLAIDDLGKLHKDGGFEVLGRLDNSDIRGCNLMM